MATRRNRKSAAKKPAPPTMRHAAIVGNFGDLVGAIVSEVERRSTGEGRSAPAEAAGLAHAARQETLAPSPTVESSLAGIELIKQNRLRAEGLLGRLICFENALRELPTTQGETSSAPLPPGMNGTLAVTGDYICEAHNALSRIGKYLGIEV